MKFRPAFAALAVTLLLGGAPALLHAQRANEPITLNFVNAEIEAVARAMAAITGRNIVVDPRVKGTITLSTDQPVPPAAAFNQFLATLRLSGFAVVESGGLLKVVPEAEAKLQGGAVSVGTPAGGSQLVTQIFRLSHENAGNLVPILRPLISPNNTINVNAGNNALVITDYADNLQRLGRIIAALDVANATDVEVINLQHAVASDVAPIVQRLVDTAPAPGVPGAPGTAAAQADAGFRTTVIAEPR
ncbi:MAG TPA: secretin N-terminal domain-containing protein, partial [Ramlibacter sp.]|nr:secretin N-terminal domain-containing protein [Ramlibacter sp.]